MSSYDDTQRRENLAIINQVVKYISAKVCGGNAMVELDIDIDSELKERMDAHLHELLNRQRDKITFERVLAVLALIQEQLMTGSGTMTKRQIYYSNVMLFDSKMEAADRAIDQTCARYWRRCPTRWAHSLGVLSRYSLQAKEWCTGP